MAKPELVIFDCDGILVDSEVISNQILVDNLGRYGLTVSLDECMGLFVGGSMTGVEAKAKELGAVLPKGWIDEIYTETYARLKQGVAPVAGVVAVLDHLDSVGVAYCVASNGSAAKMQITLGQNGMLDRFQGRIYSAHELGVSKPDPDLFLIAAGDVSAENCVVIEDSLSGVKAARAAGMKCFGYIEHGDGVALAAESAILFDDMTKLPGLLGV
ncbi:MAG: HAD-IA family hydrolase [Rhodobacteraceae bacterium]|nr:HAD-IA family hydrolase [Paracoccaceae bacterium]